MMNNTIIPLVYGWLIGKTADDYNLFFGKVLEQDSFQPESIMTDFEFWYNQVSQRNVTKCFAQR